MLPTGAKLGRCGSTRAKAPRTVRPEAKGLAVSFCIDFSLTLYIIAPPGGGLVRLPQSFRGAGGVACPTAPHEKRITQTVQIANGLGRHAGNASERDHDALGAPANSAPDMQLGLEVAAA